MMNKKYNESTILNALKQSMDQDLESVHIIPDWSILPHVKSHSIMSFKSLTYALITVMIVIVVSVSISIQAPISPTNDDVFLLNTSEDVYHMSSIASVSLLPDISVPVQSQQPLALLSLSEDTLMDMTTQINTYMSLIEKWLASSDSLLITTIESDGNYMFNTTYEMHDLLGNIVVFEAFYNVFEEGLIQGIMIRDDEIFEFESVNQLDATGSYELTTFKTEEDFTKITYNSNNQSTFVIEVYRMNQLVSLSNLTLEKVNDELMVNINVDVQTFHATYQFELNDDVQSVSINYLINNNEETFEGKIEAILIYDDVWMSYKYQLSIDDGSGSLKVSEIVRSMEDNDVSLSFEQLLESIQQQIITDFSTYTFMSAKYDDGQFIVILSDGVKLYFNPVGKLKSTEGVYEVTSVEEDDIPQHILDFIENEYPRLKIKRIEKIDEFYVIMMTANVTLIFDLEGEFIEEVATNTLNIGTLYMV